MKKEAAIREIFEQHHGIADAGTLKSLGVNHHQLNLLLEGGQVEKLKRGLYKWSETDNYHYVDVSRMVKGGVFCLFSAAFYHGLSTFYPPEYHVAIPAGKKPALPPGTLVKLHYWDETPYRLGIEEVWLNGASVKMYDAEKTVCEW